MEHLNNSVLLNYNCKVSIQLSGKTNNSESKCIQSWNQIKLLITAKVSHAFFTEHAVYSAPEHQASCNLSHLLLLKILACTSVLL